MTRRRPRTAVLSAVLLAVTALVALAATASAATGRLYEMRVVGSPRAVSLSPSALAVALGDRVAFTNASSTIVEVRVGGYDVTLVPGQSTDGGLDPQPYAALAVGRQPVTAAAEPSGARGTGAITVSAATASPGPSASASPAGVAPGRPPQLAPSPSPARSPSATPTPSGRPSARPTSPSPAAVTAAAGSPSASPLALAGRGPLQRPTSRAVGLPAAVAVILLLGVGAALVRVLLAEPVPAVDGVR